MTAASPTDQPTPEQDDPAFYLDGIRDGLACLRLAIENADSEHEPEALAGLTTLLEDTALRASRLIHLERGQENDAFLRGFKAGREELAAG